MQWLFCSWIKQSGKHDAYFTFWMVTKNIRTLFRVYDTVWTLWCHATGLTFRNSCTHNFFLGAVFSVRKAEKKIETKTQLSILSLSQCNMCPQVMYYSLFIFIFVFLLLCLFACAFFFCLSYSCTKIHFPFIASIPILVSICICDFRFCILFAIAGFKSDNISHSAATKFCEKVCHYVTSAKLTHLVYLT